MSPVTHLLIGWTLANTDRSFGRRERMAVTLAGVAPDIDGIGIVAEMLTRGSGNELLWWSNYHHTALHNLAFAIMVAIIAFVATGRVRVAMFSFASFHLHLIADIAGARGPDNDQWPIPYLMPFSDLWQFSWSGQWELNAWPNFMITILLLATCFYLAWRRGYSPLEMVSKTADRAFVQTLRNRLNGRGNNG